ncbi:MAG: hypothetical protein CMH54_12075 [Myxococcales bacterium]|nr:hypothetical protein [Myxococcales bacterium]
MFGKPKKPKMSWSRALTHAMLPSTVLVLAAVGLSISGGVEERLLWVTVVVGVLVMTTITFLVSYFLQTGRAPLGWGIAAVSALLTFSILFLVTDSKIKAIPEIPQELRASPFLVINESEARLEHSLGFSIQDVAPGLVPNEKLAEERYRAMGGRTDTAVWVYSNSNGTQHLFLAILRAFPYQEAALERFVSNFVASTGSNPRARTVQWGPGQPEARVEIPSSRRGELVLRAMPLHYNDESYLVVLWSEGIPGVQAKKIVDSLQIKQALPGPGYVR